MRYIFIGDIHGCFDELQRLLEEVAPRSRDVVVSVGDIVGKGPDADACLALWRDRGYLAVLGNHEEKLGAFDWPLYLDFPEPRIAVVHGGVMPGTRFDPDHIAMQRETITTLRFLRRIDGCWHAVQKNRERAGDRFWTELWNGDRTVVYGHTPRRAVRRDANAIGLDTSCVYGGRLTAAVYEDGWTFVSVPAARRHARRPLLGRLGRLFKRA